MCNHQALTSARVSAGAVLVFAVMLVHVLGLDSKAAVPSVRHLLSTTSLSYACKVIPFTSICAHDEPTLAPEVSVAGFTAPGFESVRRAFEGTGLKPVQRFRFTTTEDLS